MEESKQKRDKKAVKSLLFMIKGILPANYMVCQKNEDFF